jgi:hypothetical protein
LKACLTFGWIWYCKNHFLALVVGGCFEVASAVCTASLASSASSVEASAIASSTAVGSCHGSGIFICFLYGLLDALDLFFALLLRRLFMLLLLRSLLQFLCRNWIIYPFISFPLNGFDASFLGLLC